MENQKTEFESWAWTQYPESKLTENELSTQNLD